MSNSNSKLFFTLTGMIAAAGILVFMVVVPQLGRVSELRMDIAQTERHLRQVADRLREFEAARIELEKISAERQSAGALFPKREELVGAVETLEAAAVAAGAEVGLTLTDRQEQPVAEKAKPVTALVPGLQKIEEVPLAAELHSDLRGLINFLRYLENSRVLVRLAGLSVIAESVQPEGLASVPRNTGQAVTQINGVFFIRQ